MCTHMFINPENLVKTDPVHSEIIGFSKGTVKAIKQQTSGLKIGALQSLKSHEIVLLNRL